MIIRSVRDTLGRGRADPPVELGDWPTGIDLLHRHGVTTVALTPQADDDIWDVARSIGDRPVAVMVGAEGTGLTRATISAATHRASIRMAPGVDSLNVSVAAAVALHHLRPRPA